MSYHPPLSAMQPELKPPPLPPQVYHKRRVRLFLVVAVFLGIVLGVIAALMILFGGPDNGFSNLVRKGLPLASPNPGEQILLVMGVDVDYENGRPATNHRTRTDTLILVRLYPKKNTLAMVSIPRDSKVYYPGSRGIGKINSIHAMGGPQMVVEAVEQSFGIPVDHYMVVNLQGVEKLVDAMGGIDVTVEKPLHYRDNTAHLNIALDPGVHTLSGKETLGFLRFRHDALGDIGRVRRQQQFVAALAKKMKDPWMVSKVPALVELGSQYVQTDMGMDDMLKIALFAKSVDMKTVRQGTIPGYPATEHGISYWIVQPQETQDMLDRLILAQEPQSSAVSFDNPLEVGLFYPPQLIGELPQIIEAIEKQPFKVTCKQAKTNLTTTLFEHSNRVTRETTKQLLQTNHHLQDVRLIYAPVGGSYETTNCSTSEDYTLVLGNDFLPKPEKGNNHE